MLSLLAKTMFRRTKLTMPRADPEEVAGVRTPAPWKITNSIGLYRNMQLHPLHLGKVEPHGDVRASFSMEYRKVIVLMIVFFEKAMITGHPLQNKLRTYRKKRREKTTSELFLVSPAWTPLPPPNPTKNSWIRAWIYVIVVVKKRYRSLKPSIVLPRSNDHVYICLFVNIGIKTIGWHIQQSGVVLKTV